MSDLPECSIVSDQSCQTVTIEFLLLHYLKFNAWCDCCVKEVVKKREETTGTFLSTRHCTREKNKIKWRGIYWHEEYLNTVVSFPPSNRWLHDSPLRLRLLTVIGRFFATMLTVTPPVFPRYLEAISYVFPLMLMMAWMLFVADFVKKLVHERELRLHEVMLFAM